MHIRILEELGLSEAEAKIYLALLELGTSKTGKIIDKTKLQSSTVYHVLGALVEKGLASFIHEGKIKFYQAERPESLLMFLDEKRKKLKTIMPELKERESQGNKKQTAKVYQGIKGLRAAFNDILEKMKKGEEYYFFSAPRKEFFNQNVVLFFRNFHLRRAENGIKVKGLSLKGSRKIIDKIFQGVKLHKIKYIGDFAPQGIVVYKNKLITIDWDDTPTAVVIESKSIANSYKKFFEQKWRIAKK